MAVDGAENAAVLAAQMLALGDLSLNQELSKYKAQMDADVTAKDEKVRAQYV